MVILSKAPISLKAASPNGTSSGEGPQNVRHLLRMNNIAFENQYWILHFIHLYVVDDPVQSDAVM
jgi:hypothetical protein